MMALASSHIKKSTLVSEVSVETYEGVGGISIPEAPSQYKGAIESDFIPYLHSL